MPTASKLVAAIAFAALAWFISDLVKPLLPEGTQFDLLSPINALFGLIMGWRIMGRNAGNGLVASSGYGLTTLVATVFWCLLAWAGYEMVIRSTRLRYDGPVQALQDMVTLMIEYGQLASTNTVLAAALAGSLFCAWLSELAARRWT